MNGSGIMTKRKKEIVSDACCATVVQHHLPKLTVTKLQLGKLWEASLLFWPDYLSVRICRSFGYRITGGYCCQQGLVFQKDSHHTTPWKWVLQTYALEALNASRLWKQMFHQRRKDNEKHRSASRHIRCMWLTLIISISHTEACSAFLWQSLRSLSRKTYHILKARS